MNKTIRRDRPARSLDDALHHIPSAVLPTSANSGQACRSYPDLRSELFGGETCGFKIVIDRHHGATYMGRKSIVKPKLHGVAFHSMSTKRMIPSMPRKSAKSTRFKYAHFFRQWRQYRGLTQAQLVARLEELPGDGIPQTTASLSRLENGIQPYSQPLLEALADVLSTDPASLLMRNPLSEDGIWSIWDRASPGQRDQIVRVADALVPFKHEEAERTGTDG